MGRKNILIELMNGARIVLKGEDNETSLRGASLDGVIFWEGGMWKRLKKPKY